MTASHTSSAASADTHVADLIAAGSSPDHVARSLDLFHRALRLSPNPGPRVDQTVTFSTGTNQH